MKKNSIKKILVVAESIDVEDSSGTKGRVALIKNLHKAGFELIVYHYSHKEIKLSGIPCVAIKENRHSLLFFLSRLERQIRYKTGYKLNKYVEQLFGFSFTLLNDRNSIVAGLKKIKYIKPDLILTLSKGGSFRPHHALLKIPAWHSKWMAYIHDPYPFSCYPRPYDWVEPGHSEKRNFMIAVAKKAKYLGYPSKLLAEWMESYYPPLRGKSVIVPHQIDDDGTNSAKLPDYFQKDFFTIVHAGALMSARNPMVLINAFRKFLKKMPKASNESQLLFIGKKSKFSREFEKVKEEIPQFYASEDYVPFFQVLSIQKSAAVNVILEAKGSISPFLPGKFPHCIHAGKPILLLGPYYSESKRLLGEDYPWWSEINDEERIFEIIQKLYQNWTNSNNATKAYEGLRNYLSPTNLKYVFDKI